MQSTQDASGFPCAGAKVLSSRRQTLHRKESPVFKPTAIAVSLALTVPAAADAAGVAPHRAVYDLTLATARSGAQVSAVDGEMTFRWADTCDGWTIEQHYRLDFLYTQGMEVELTSSYAIWESRDGTELAFSTRTASNGVVDEEIRGVASRPAADRPGTVVYRLPEETERPLPAGVLFPTAHTIELLDRAETGAMLFTALLFDGTHFDELTEISAVIGTGRAAPDTAEEPLLARPSWPVRLAFFTAADALPDYEIAVRLFDNGVIDTMDIDYGDFVVRATLTELEALPDDC